jgi:acyl-CoA reductase-like NAD-dependent aldehyde dehydrogenase
VPIAEFANQRAGLAPPTPGAVSRKSITVRDPASGRTVGTVPLQDADEVEAAVRRARAAQERWAAMPVRERGAALRAARRAFVAARGEIVELLAAETGKPRFDVTGEAVAVCLDFQAARRVAPRALAPQRVGRRLGTRKRRLVLYKPHGVVGVIGPWNAPLTLTLGDAIYALAAGNAVIVKPSEVTPLAVRRAVAAIATALPADVIQVTTGDAATGAALVDHVDMVCVTGSPETGRAVMARAARRLVPVLLELGGKDPMVVLEDANLKRAANAAAWGGFFMTGQVCMSIERVFVVDAVAEEFVRRVVECTRRLRVGPNSDEVDLGPMVTARQLAIVEQHVADARTRGAVVEIGAERLTHIGEQFYAPTVLTGVTPDMQIMRDETFGPVLSICRVRDEHEAVALANASPFGLNASIWTADRARGLRLAQQLVSGSVCINDCILNAGDPELPFGGVKQSGIGTRHGGIAGVRAFTRPCAVRIDPGHRARDAAWFPYRRWVSRWVERAMGWIWG